MRDDDRPPPPPNPVADAAGFLRLLTLAAECVAYPMELMTRRIGSMGVEYPGPVVTLGGVVVAPLLAVAVAPPHYGAGWVGVYLWGLFGLAVAHAVAKRVRKEHEHRHYIGTPWVGETRKRDGETLLGGVIMVGSFLVSDTLGWFHLASLVCARLVVDLIVERDKRIVRRMKDAQIDARYYADRLRDGR
jgi:hypothetical protein